MIAFCGCKEDSRKNTQAAAFQDKQFGPGMRAFTGGGSGVNEHKKHRCTLCGSEKR